MVTVTTAKIPRAVRNNNALNIKRSSINWAGKSAVQQDAVFETFDSPFYGIRAGARNLLTYYRRDKLNTIAEIVSKWAPPDDDNDTSAYIDAVAARMGGGITPDTELNLENPEILTSLVIAMMKQEIGPIPESYTPQMIESAVVAAYSGGTAAPVVDHAPVVVPPIVHVPPVVPVVPTVAPGNPPPLVDQPTASPTNKVTAGSIGAMGGLPVAFVAKVIWDKYVPDQPMPTEIAIAIAAAASSAFSFVAGYYTRNRAVVPVVPVVTTPSVQG